jgi:hypothetical protein
LHRGGRVQEPGSDRDGETVFARLGRASVERTRAGDRVFVVDADAVIVGCWVNVARIPDANVAVDQRELESLVLGAFEEARRTV